MLRRYALDLSHVLDFEDLYIQDVIFVVDQPVQILDQLEQVLQSKVILLWRYSWPHHRVEGAIWVPEDMMRE